MIAVIVLYVMWAAAALIVGHTLWRAWSGNKFLTACSAVIMIGCLAFFFALIRYFQATS